MFHILYTYIIFYILYILYFIYYILYIIFYILSMYMYVYIFIYPCYTIVLVGYISMKGDFGFAAAPPRLRSRAAHHALLSRGSARFDDAERNRS